MGQVAAVMMIGSAIVGAGASIYQGRQISKQEGYRRDTMKQQLRQQEVAALQSENERRRKLGLLQAENIARGTESGFSTLVPGTSFGAIRDENTSLAMQDIDAIRSGYVNQQGNWAYENMASKQRGDDALTASYISAGSSLLGGASNAAQLRGPPSNISGKGISGNKAWWDLSARPNELVK